MATAKKKGRKQPKLPAHGTMARYNGTAKRKPCKCEKCKRANTLYNRKLKKKRTPPKGKALTRAQRSLRDVRMLSRHFQGWTLEEIAEESGIRPDEAGKIVRQRKESQPRLLNRAETEIIEQLIQELQVSISDLEKIAEAALETSQISAAVGAKKAAMDGRKDLRELLQSVGALPHDLGTLTHLIDMRTVITSVFDVVQSMEEKIREMHLPPEEESKIIDVTGTAAAKLGELAGIPQTTTDHNGEENTDDHDHSV